MPKKPNIINLTAAAKILGISRQAFLKRVQVLPVPKYVSRVGKLFKIDIAHKDFKLLIQEVKHVSVIRDIEKSKTIDLKLEETKSRIYKSRKFPASLRHIIFKRDNFTCSLCGKHKDNLKKNISLEVDHVTEWEDGGLTTYSNGQTVCGTCNKGKHYAKALVEKKVVALGGGQSKKEKMLADLQFESVAAKLQLPIQRTKLNAYKIQQEKIELETQSKRVIPLELADFLFIGYIERLNVEVLNFPKRIEKEIDLIIQGGMHAGLDPHKISKSIIKIICREQEAILRDIKKEQKKDVEAWKEGEK